MDAPGTDVVEWSWEAYSGWMFNTPAYDPAGVWLAERGGEFVGLASNRKLGFRPLAGEWRRRKLL